MIATLTGAFYFLLPQLANVDDSVEALRSANWGWLAACVVDVRRDLRRSRDRHARRRVRAPAIRPDRPGATRLVVRQPGHAGQRRRHGAQRALPAEGGGPAGGGRDRHGAQRPRRRRRAHRAADRLLRLGRPGRGGVRAAEQQQAARGHRRRAGPDRHRRGHPSWAPPAAGARARRAEAVARQHRLARPVAAPAARPVRRIDRGHPRLHRSHWRAPSTPSMVGSASPRSARCTSDRR